MSEVFLSYRQTDDAQKQRVRAFGERLRAAGITVFLDQFLLDEEAGGPSEGWDKWSSDCAINTEYVLIIGTRDWFEGFEKTQPTGTALGVVCEADDIRGRIYEKGGIVDDIRVVLLDDADKAHIPAKLRPYRYFHADRDFADIVRWLGGTVTTNPTMTSTMAVEASDRRKAVSVTSDLVKKFYGNDPVEGENAANEILDRLGADAIKALVPLDTDVYRYSTQIEMLLKYIASRLGGQIVPHLVSAISSAPWHSKMTAAVCFSGLVLQMKLKAR